MSDEIEELRKRAEALKPKYPELTFRAFLEEMPPDTYAYLTDVVVGMTQIKMPDIMLFCPGEECSGERLHRTQNTFSNTSLVWHHEFIQYVCRNCGKHGTRFAVSLYLSGSSASVTVLKLGQNPQFGPLTPARLITLIGPDKEIFLQGRRAENRGMGIGAFAYYRRVVENQKNRIIAEIAKAAKVLGSPPDTDALFQKSLKETRFSESLNMVKNLIPQALLINGHNPLTLLHSALSKGLHNPDMTDAHCLALAQSIRTVLGELAERSAEVLKSTKEIQSAITVLMAVPDRSTASDKEASA